MFKTFSEVKLLLQHKNIPHIIQQKIFTLILSYGTPSANIIKQECLKLQSISHYEDDNIITLWRFKLFTSNYSIIQYDTFNKIGCELIIAALYAYNFSHYLYDRNKFIINKLTEDYLYHAFYNLDKFYYGEYGTPTANIIRKHFKYDYPSGGMI